jgi:SpoVK/Ycf46/Vps4 family AAA+-type ATPase
MGLTWGEIENVLAKSLVSSGALDKKVVQEEKKQVVKRSQLLEFVETGAANAPKVGGLESLKEWLGNRKRGFSEEARTAGLPLPKGILLVGVPGCGKSLTAMTVGKEWELPLLRLDMGKLFSGLVGSSESNMRQALSTCEAVAPCVLWIDEIEKGMSGMGSSGSSDGGTTSRVFGTFLTWMQEKKEPVFVVATANDISGLPPEFLRKGRFDEIFFVDLPSRAERSEIFKIHLEKSGVDLAEFKSESLLKLSEGFSGAEIEQAIVEARYQAFGSHQKVEVSHLTQVLSETVPLSKTQSDRIASLREWAKNRTRFASKRADLETDNRFEGRREALELKS